MEKEAAQELMTPAELKQFEMRIGYSFASSIQANIALTHLSYANEHGLAHGQSYEKLEFLGDTVLQLVVSDILIRRFPNAKEGQLSRLRSRIVSEDSLARIGKYLALGQFIKLGKGEDADGGREKKSILADVVESIIGAVYVDSYPTGGLETVYQMIRVWVSPPIEKLAKLPATKNSRSCLNELAQKNGWKNLEFRCTDESGPDHQKSYTIQVYIDDKEFGQGTAGNKKTAAIIAAEETLLMLEPSV